MKSLNQVILEVKTPKLPNLLYHKSNPINRNNIEKDGLKIQVGDSYIMHWEVEKDSSKLEKLIFMYDKNVDEYDTTYDDDIWEIDVSKLDKSKIHGDPDTWMWKNKGCWVYTKDIPTEAIKLVYKGTGDSLY
mgnify:CR=1 FL=1